LESERAFKGERKKLDQFNTCDNPHTGFKGRIFLPTDEMYYFASSYEISEASF